MAVSSSLPATTWYFEKLNLTAHLRHIWAIKPGESAGKYSFECRACGKSANRMSVSKRSELCPGS